tara:strand:+ start:1157 stop:1558 length:402 start_codon:yes stop_codon:yes gene_type:complete
MSDAEMLIQRVMGIVENTVRLAGTFSNPQTTNVYVLHKQTNGIIRMNTSMLMDLRKTEYSAVCHVTLVEGSYILVSSDAHASITARYCTDTEHWEIIDEPTQKAVDSVHETCAICIPIPRKAVPHKGIPLIFH